MRLADGLIGLGVALVIGSGGAALVRSQGDPVPSAERAFAESGRKFDRWSVKATNLGQVVEERDGFVYFAWVPAGMSVCSMQ